MFAKIKDNLGLIATALALMGTIGTGLSTAGEIVNTLQGIDDRMNQVEVDFEMLKESTFVQGDIAVLFEKVQKLEIANDTNQYVQIEKWEWDDIKIQITRLETQLMDQDQDLNVVREIQTRLAWIEANCCNGR